MELNRGDVVQTTDCHQRPVKGEIIQLLEHTVIVAKGEERVVVPKKTLTQAGYTFAPFKWRNAFMTAQDRAEEQNQRQIIFMDHVEVFLKLRPRK